MENKVLELFYNHPTRQWHFSDIRECVPIADNKISKWLKKLTRGGLIKRIKKQGKMPYYVANFESSDYMWKKRLFALEKFYETGFLNHLMQLKARTIIIFGSFARWDWHDKSDIDVFIYGNDSDFEQGKYELKLGRQIQIFNCRNTRQLRKFDSKLLRNIVRGETIKGNIDFIEICPSN